MAAARGACVNDDHAAEWRYRNTARLIRRLPPLSDKARCLVKRPAGTAQRWRVRGARSRRCRRWSSQRWRPTSGGRTCATAARSGA